MEFGKKSHLVQLEHDETYDKTNLLSRGQEVVWDQEPEPEEVGVDLLRPGEFSLHHIRLAHMSGPNNSENRRLGMAIRYMPTWSRSVLRDGIGVMLVRGVDEYGHFRADMPGLKFRVRSREDHLGPEGPGVVPSGILEAGPGLGAGPDQVFRAR